MYIQYIQYIIYQIYPKYKSFDDPAEKVINSDIITM